jgi:hypothetical protein
VHCRRLVDVETATRKCAFFIAARARQAQNAAVKVRVTVQRP